MSTPGSEHADGALGRVGRGTAITWVSWAGGRVLTLATLLLLFRIDALTQHHNRGVGEILAALATGVLGASVAMGGLPDATTRNAAASATGTDFGRGDLRRALRRFTATLPGIAVLVVLVSYGTSGPIDAGVVVSALLLAITQGATTIVASVYRARGDAARFAFITTVFISAGRAVVAVFAFALAASVAVVLWSFVALNVLLIALTWRAATRDLPDSQTHAEGQGAMQLGGVVWSLMGNLDLVTVGVVLGAGAAGDYGAALRIGEISIQFLVALSVIYLPEATRLAVGGHTNALRALYRTTSRWSTLVSVLAAGIGFVAAPSLAHIVVRTDQHTVTTLMRILFAGYALHGALGQTYSTLLATGSYRDIWRSSIVSLPAIVVATVALTVVFGTVGAAASTCVAYALTGVWWAWQVRRRIGVTPFDHHYTRALGAVLASLVPAGAVAAVSGPLTPVGSLVVTCLVGAAAAVLLIRALGGLNSPERARAAQLVVRLRGSLAR